MIITEQGYLEHIPTLKKETMDVLSKPLRSPCKYCGKTHAEYACDKQIEHLKKLIQDARDIKKN